MNIKLIDIAKAPKKKTTKKDRQVFPGNRRELHHQLRKGLRMLLIRAKGAVSFDTSKLSFVADGHCIKAINLAEGSGITLGAAFDRLAAVDHSRLLKHSRSA